MFCVRKVKQGAQVSNECYKNGSSIFSIAGLVYFKDCLLLYRNHVPKLLGSEYYLNSTESIAEYRNEVHRHWSPWSAWIHNIICDAHKVKSWHVFKLSLDVASVSIVLSFFYLNALSGAWMRQTAKNKKKIKSFKRKQLVVRRCTTNIHI